MRTKSENAIDAACKSSASSAAGEEAGVTLNINGRYEGLGGGDGVDRSELLVLASANMMETDAAGGVQSTSTSAQLDAHQRLYRWAADGANVDVVSVSPTPTTMSLVEPLGLVVAAADASSTSVVTVLAAPLKKSRSLEDVCRGARAVDVGSQPSHEMEFMSSRIQSLKVQD